MTRIILDLCGGTGSWSQPYHEAGYDVVLITLPKDIRLSSILEVMTPGLSKVHGILAAPPCTEFSSAKHYHGKGNYTHDFKEGLSVVDACLRFVAICRPQWWAMENPKGYLQRFIGPPDFSFDPWEYGDPYQKRTSLWGDFTYPKKTVQSKPGGLKKFSLLKSKEIRPEAFGKFNRTERRAITPAGFAQAFFEANP